MLLLQMVMSLVLVLVLVRGMLLYHKGLWYRHGGYGWCDHQARSLLNKLRPRRDSDEMGLLLWEGNVLRQILLLWRRIERPLLLL